MSMSGRAAVALLLAGMLAVPSCGSERRRSGAGEPGEGEGKSEGEGEGEGGGEGEGEGEGGGEGEGEGQDAGRDAGQDGGADAGPDAGLDAGLDAGRDTGPPDGGEPDLGPPPCSPEHQQGVCPSPDEVCVAGGCVPLACSPEHPQGSCAGDLLCLDGECVLPPCDDEHPFGRCEPGFTCRDGECVEANLQLLELAVVEDGPPAGALPGCGAHNGIADAGELVGLTISVTNRSQNRYLSLGATLVSDDEEVAQVLAEAAIRSYPDLSPGESGGPDAPFVVRLGEVPDGTVVPLLLHFVDSRLGEVDTLGLRLGVRRGVRLGAARIFIDDDSLGDSRGDGDHLLDPGELVDLQVDLGNMGTVGIPLPRLPGDQLAPAAGDPWVTFGLSTTSSLLELDPPAAPPRFEGVLAAGDTVEAAAELALGVRADAAAGAHGCLTLTFQLGEGDAELYRFSETRCFELGSGLGPVCEPREEQCNDLDDDCNSLIDDGLPLNPCGRCGPTPPETCNGEDDDCDGEIDDEVTAPDGVCPALGVCRDATPRCQGAAGWTCDLPASHESPERSCDGLDNDCDGAVDEELAAPAGTCPALGVCRDGTPRCRGAAGWTCDLPANHESPERSCDGLDNDCDGTTDEGVNAPAGTCPVLGVCAAATPVCGGASGWSCSFPANHESPERSCDGLDNDCDGTTDEGVSAPAGTCPILGVCAAATPTCGGASGWSCSFPPNHERPEQTCDGLDNDCDGLVDEGLTAPAGTCPVHGVCAAATPSCGGASGWSCTYPASYENPERSCDGLDNDCDGTTDEGVAAPAGTCPVLGVCAAATPRCGGASGWSCTYPANYESPERSCDGLDNDCDGSTDEGVSPPAGTCPVLGVCAAATPRCGGASGWSCSFPANYENPEQSCDGLDNDCDGLVDEELPLNACGRCGPLPPEGCGDDCDDAVPIRFDADGHAYVEGDTSTLHSDYSGSCGGGSARDMVFRFTLDQPRARSTFHMEGLLDQPGEWDTVLYLRGGDCTGQTTLACNDDGLLGVGSSDFSLPLAPGEYWLFADGYSSSAGPFFIDIQLGSLQAAPVVETCASAERHALTPRDPPLLLEGALGLARDDLPEGSCFSGEGGGELVYRIDLSAAASLTVDGRGLDQGPIALRLLGTACSGPSAVELACGQGGLAEPLLLELPNVAAGSYWLIVDAAGPYTHRFSISVTALAPALPPGNEDCASAAELSWTVVDGRPQLVASGNHLIARDDLAATCGGAGAGDTVHRFHLSQPSALTFEPVVPAEVELVYSLRSAPCAEPLGERLCSGSAAPALLERLDAGDHFLVVDAPAAGGGGAYDITVTAYPPVPEEDGSCAAPLPLAFDADGRALALGDTTGSGAVLRGTCTAAPGAEQVYGFSLDEPRGRSTFRMQSFSWAMWDTVLYLRLGSCGVQQDLGCSDDDGPGASSFSVPRLAPGEYFLIADAYRLDGGGPFLLGAELGPPLPPPANDTCATAAPLTIGRNSAPLEVEGEVGAAGDHLPAGSCPAAAAVPGGGDVVYALSVLDPLMLLLAAEPLDHGGVAVQLLAGACSGQDAQELACVEQPDGRAETVLRRVEPGTYWIVVSAATPTSDRFRLHVQAFPPPDETQNDTCAGASSLSWDEGWDIPRISLRGNATEAADDRAGTCGGAGLGDLFYRFDLAQRASLALSSIEPVRGTGLFYLLQGGCGAAAPELLCLAAGQEAFLPDLDAGAYWLVAESSLGADGWPFELEILRYPPLTATGNSSCASPLPLTVDAQGRALILGTTAEAANDHHDEGLCTSAPGPEQVFSLHLPRRRSASRISVTSKPWGGWDTVLYVERNPCNPPSPVGCNDDGPGGVGTSEIRLNGLEAGDYTITVDGYHTDDKGYFLLDVQLGEEL